jgi:hypothetical protein
MTRMAALIVISTAAFGCGCVDAPQAIASATFMNKTYHSADYALSRALESLGGTVKDGYTAMSNGAMDAERIARVKKEQALILKKIGFDTESAADQAAVSNRIGAKAAEILLIKTEKNTLFKARVLNREEQK